MRARPLYALQPADLNKVFFSHCCFSCFAQKRTQKKATRYKACIKLHAKLSFSFGIGGKGNHVDRYETGRSASTMMTVNTHNFFLAISTSTTFQHFHCFCCAKWKKNKLCIYFFRVLRIIESCPWIEIYAENQFVRIVWGSKINEKRYLLRSAL